MTSEYDIQAEQFLEKTLTVFKAVFLKHDKHFADDKETRDIYTIELSRGNRKWTIMFGQSLNKSISPEYRKQIKNQKRNLDKLKPTAYDVLSCITKYDPGSFEDFCSEYGYDEDSKKAETIYKGVLDEWQNVQVLWNDDEIAILREIQ